MENLNLPLRKWYVAMAFMSFSKKGISAAEMQRQLDHTRYETVWKLVHKIRCSMGKRDCDYLLQGMYEFDEGFFRSVPEKRLKAEQAR